MTTDRIIKCIYLDTYGYNVIPAASEIFKPLHVNSHVSLGPQLFYEDLNPIPVQYKYEVIIIPIGGTIPPKSTFINCFRAFDLTYFAYWRNYIEPRAD